MGWFGVAEQSLNPMAPLRPAEFNSDYKRELRNVACVHHASDPLKHYLKYYIWGGGS